MAHCEELIERLHELDFEVDGLVLKVNDFDQRERLGSTSKSPRWLIAYKFEKYEATTRLLDIRVQVGKTGAITPVADLEPVELAGTIVRRASLHNADEIERKDVRVGDVVVVEKAGKIIPHIVRVEKHERQGHPRKFVFPTHCPECDTALVKDEGGVYIRCPNPRVPGAGQGADALLRQPQRDGHRRAGRQAGRSTGRERRGEKLRRSVSARSRHARKPGADGPQVVGESAGGNRGEQIARTGPAAQCPVDSPRGRVAWPRCWPSTFASMEALQAASVEELAEVHEIGPIIAESVYAFLHSAFGRRTIDDLQSAGRRK